MSSNATIFAGDIIQKLSKNFKSLGVGLSIDGMDGMYNYLRYLGNLSIIKENLKIGPIFMTFEDEKSIESAHNFLKYHSVRYPRVKEINF